MAERRLRWGILSTARIGRTLFMPGVRAGEEGELAAIASRRLDVAEVVAAEFAIPRAFGAYDDLLDDPEIDAIYNPLPNRLHAEWTMRAARAGKHVLCEKPLARTGAEAQEMARVCQQAGVLLIEAFMWRHHPQHARVRALLDAGQIGEPRMVRSSFSYMIGPEPSNVRLQRDLEGGSLMDVGCYPVNVARWVFQAEPIDVVGRQIVDPTYNVETTFAGVLTFPGDRLALIDSSFGQAGQTEYEIVGTEGRIVVDRAFRPDARPGRIHVLRGQEQRTEEVAPADQFALEADHFARSIRAGRVLDPAENGVAQARVIEALYASAESAPLP
ncbi:MAG TPA: Gfo/Idh/MocA family oxidoreductase [Chloroflexota bacterium]|jgi:predicted dehydrogenase